LKNKCKQLEFSVSICTYNGEKRLPEVLAALNHQECIENEDWELILIDNASTDKTEQVFSNFAVQHSNISCRYVYEPIPGQAAARIRAYQEAQGKWICFVDDDNILDSHYLSIALSYTKTNTKIGVLGGKSIARLSVSPPDWFGAVKSGLAIWDGGVAPRRLEVGERSFTAGLFVNAAVAKQVSNETWVMTGRTKDILIGGEDTELCLKILRKGWEMWYAPELKFEHVISEDRLKICYLKDLFATFGANHILLHPVYFPIMGSKYISMLKILTTALLKFPFFYLLSLFPNKNRWTHASRAWAYLGVMKYCRYAYKRVTEI
jgi:glycosyltransferase involved in cell wall biosynthesis